MDDGTDAYGFHPLSTDCISRRHCFGGKRLRGLEGIVNLMQKIARLCRKERPIHGFVLSRTPVFSPLTQPQIFSRERPLDAIFNKLTMPLCGMPGGCLLPARGPSMTNRPHLARTTPSAISK